MTAAKRSRQGCAVVAAVGFWRHFSEWGGTTTAFNANASVTPPTPPPPSLALAGQKCKIVHFN